MASFKQWLEGITSHDQVQMLPNMGNADLKRGDVNSRYFARAQSYASLPPGDDGEEKVKHPIKDPEEQFGFDAGDRKKAKPRKVPNHIDKRRKIVPMRVTQVYS